MKNITSKSLSDFNLKKVTEEHVSGLLSLLLQRCRLTDINYFKHEFDTAEIL